MENWFFNFYSAMVLSLLSHSLSSPISPSLSLSLSFLLSPSPITASKYNTIDTELYTHQTLSKGPQFQNGYSNYIEVHWDV